MIVTAAMPEIEGHPLIGQLKPNGKLIAPVGNKFYQDLVLYENSNNEYKKILPVIFVPLIGKCGFQK